MIKILDEEQIEKVKNCLDQSRISFSEPMYEHTSFRIGGPAELFVSPTLEELPLLMQTLKADEIPFIILGNGSNVLVSDEGIGGVVVSTLNMKNIHVDADRQEIMADAGVSLSKIATEAAMQSLTGMEFAAGIPGSLGGAIFMNAGAYGGEMKDVLVEVSYLDMDGQLVKKPVEELDLGYRHSFFSDKPDLFITGARLKLSIGDKATILAYQTDLLRKRKDKQPLEFPSAGSTFKRPEGHFAGQLIQEAGLMGYSVGDAQVSEKHAGFVINRGSARAQDVLSLIEHVQKTVFEKSGVRLEPEVRILGERL